MTQNIFNGIERLTLRWEDQVFAIHEEQAYRVLNKVLLGL